MPRPRKIVDSARWRDPTISAKGQYSWICRTCENKIRASDTPTHVCFHLKPLKVEKKASPPTAMIEQLETPSKLLQSTGLQGQSAFNLNQSIGEERDILEYKAIEDISAQDESFCQSLIPLQLMDRPAQKNWHSADIHPVSGAIKGSGRSYPPFSGITAAMNAEIIWEDPSIWRPFFRQRNDSFTIVYQCRVCQMFKLTPLIFHRHPNDIARDLLAYEITDDHQLVEVEPKRHFVLKKTRQSRRVDYRTRLIQKEVERKSRFPTKIMWEGINLVADYKQELVNLKSRLDARLKKHKRFRFFSKHPTPNKFLEQCLIQAVQRYFLHSSIRLEERYKHQRRVVSEIMEMYDLRVYQSKRDPIEQRLLRRLNWQVPEVGGHSKHHHDNEAWFTTIKPVNAKRKKMLLPYQIKHRRLKDHQLWFGSYHTRALNIWTGIIQLVWSDSVADAWNQRRAELQGQITCLLMTQAPMSAQQERTFKSTVKSLIVNRDSLPRSFIPTPSRTQCYGLTYFSPELILAVYRDKSPEEFKVIIKELADHEIFQGFGRPQDYDTLTQIQTLAHYWIPICEEGPENEIPTHKEQEDEIEYVSSREFYRRCLEEADIEIQRTDMEILAEPVKWLSWTLNSSDQVAHHSLLEHSSVYRLIPDRLKEKALHLVKNTMKQMNKSSLIQRILPEGALSQLYEFNKSQCSTIFPLSYQRFHDTKQSQQFPKIPMEVMLASSTLVHFDAEENYNFSSPRIFVNNLSLK